MALLFEDQTLDYEVLLCIVSNYWSVDRCCHLNIIDLQFLYNDRMLIEIYVARELIRLHQPYGFDAREKHAHGLRPGYNQVFRTVWSKECVLADITIAQTMYRINKELVTN